ncbi:NAD(P)-binding protein [Marasmius fiardii PR-910]|nr:NAD(P)-binding protein [Marasmius fiardii PR-910]
MFDPKTDLVDLKGKVVIVTGGNRGIGYGTVLHLARAGAKVYLAARDENKANVVIAQLKQEGFEDVHWLKFNLSDPREARKAADDFIAKEKRLDILVNNAAVTRYPFEKTPDGPSAMVTTNYISPFVFTEALLPLLTSTALKEIDDLCVEYKGKFMSGFLQYAHSKLLDLIWTKHLQKRLDAADPAVPITVMAIHPGGVDTFTDNYPLPWLTKPLVRLTIKSPERGAYTSVFAAASEAVKKERDKYKGAYLESSPVGRIAMPSSDVVDERNWEELYVLTQKFLTGIGM